MPDKPPHPDTFVAHGDRRPDDDSDVAPPLHQTATFRAASDADFDAMAATPRHERYYTRDGNPTFSRVETLVAGLEGADAAVLMSSGMAAISTSILSLVSAGDHIVAQKTHYMGTSQLLGELLPRFGVSVSWVDQTHTAAFADALTPRTRLIMVESPSNPLLALTDLTAVATLARARRVLTLCDGTIATPVNQRPLTLGIDLVVHSATKYLGGHHDLMAGIVAGPKDLIDRIAQSRVLLGPVPDPFAAWLLLRGLRTLPVRIERQNHTALTLARYLATHPAVRAVHYPGLPTHPQHELARRQMPGGYGGLMSVDLHGGLPAVQRFLSCISLPGRAVSFGGFESLMTQPAGMWLGAGADGVASEAGIGPGLVRFSVGLEHPDDLRADLEGALAGMAPT